MLNVKITYKYVLSVYLLQVNCPFLNEFKAILNPIITKMNNAKKTRIRVSKDRGFLDAFDNFIYNSERKIKKMTQSKT